MTSEEANVKLTIMHDHRYSVVQRTLQIVLLFTDVITNIRSEKASIDGRQKHDGASAKSDVPLITCCYSLTINIWTLPSY